MQRNNNKSLGAMPQWPCLGEIFYFSTLSYQDITLTIIKYKKNWLQKSSLGMKKFSSESYKFVLSTKSIPVVISPCV